MSERPQHSLEHDLPVFDPKPSALLGYEILTEVGQPFALIGKVAMWMHQVKDAQEFTKDVDFAVPRQAKDAIEAALVRRGLIPRELSIGGIAVRDGEVRVDFIDRREGELSGLFEEAIADAAQRGGILSIGDGSIPVVRVEYLIALKVVTGEDKDETDAVKLLQSVAELDLSSTREVIRRHGGPAGANSLDALARRAGRADARPSYRNGGG